MTAGDRLAPVVKLNSLAVSHNSGERTGWSVKLVAFFVAYVLHRQAFRLAGGWNACFIRRTRQCQKGECSRPDQLCEALLSAIFSEDSD